MPRKPITRRVRSNGNIYHCGRVYGPIDERILPELARQRVNVEQLSPKKIGYRAFAHGYLYQGVLIQRDETPQRPTAREFMAAIRREFGRDVTVAEVIRKLGPEARKFFEESETQAAA